MVEKFPVWLIFRSFKATNIYLNETIYKTPLSFVTWWGNEAYWIYSQTTNSQILSGYFDIF